MRKTFEHIGNLLLTGIIFFVVVAVPQLICTALDAPINY